MLLLADRCNVVRFPVSFRLMMKARKKILLPLITSLTFAGSFVAGKYTIFDMQPLTITLIRYIIALLFLTAFFGA